MEPGVHDSLLRLALEALPQGVFLANPAGAIVLTNGELRRQFGYADVDLIGQPASLLLSESSTDRDAVWHRACHDSLRDPAGGGFALTARRRDGTSFPVELTLRQLVDTGLILGTVVDFAARRVADGPAGARQSNASADFDSFRSRLTSPVDSPDNLIGESRALKGVLAQVRQVAATDSTVLFLGETGTGKELLATYLHELSARRNKAMVRVNCAAIPSTLIESELFGREKGAFTGAHTRQVGRFELADRSTIFLDEIGDLPLEVQVKLLRVLEERQIERLGNPSAIRVNVRIIAATHRDLDQRVAAEMFREDLFYRLNVFPISVPPLRERMEDLPSLVWRFVDEFAKAFGKRIDAISAESLPALERYSWPGNIRELRNVVERAMILATGPRLTITPPTSAPAARSVPRRGLTLTEIETEHIRSVLESVGWRVRGVGGAADRLGLKPTTLETRMAKLEIVRPKPVQVAG